MSNAIITQATPLVFVVAPAPASAEPDFDLELDCYVMLCPSCGWAFYSDTSSGCTAKYHEHLHNIRQLDPGDRQLAGHGG